MSIYLGTAPNSEHLDPGCHSVILHHHGRCTVYTTGTKRATGEYVLVSQSSYRFKPEHDDDRLLCTKYNKKLIGLLRETDLERFESEFDRYMPRKSQFTVFRFLWALVDCKILNKVDVINAEPKFDTGDPDFGKGTLDLDK